MNESHLNKVNQEKIFFSFLVILISLVFYIASKESYIFNLFDLLKVVNLSISLIFLPLLTSSILLLALLGLGLYFKNFEWLSIVLFFITLYGPIQLVKELLSLDRIPRYFLMLIPYLFFLGYVILSRNYMSPFFFETIATDGNSSDTYYHLAIAHLFQKENFPSIGLDGLRFQQYHFGSHILFSSISSIFNIHIVFFYCLALPILFIPLFFSTIVKLSLAFSEGGKDESLARSIISLFVLAMGALPVFLKEKISMWQSEFVSESYLVSLYFALVWIFLIFMKNEKRIQDWILIILLTLFIGISKVSTLFVLMCFWGFYLFFTKKLIEHRNFVPYLILAILSAVTVALVLPTGNYNAGSTSIEWFSFYNRYQDIRFLPIHLIFFYLPVWFILFNQDLQFFKIKLPLIATLIVTALPGILIDIPGGSAYYFIDVIKWICLPFVITIVFFKKLNRFFQIISLAYVTIIFIQIASFSLKYFQERKGQSIAIESTEKYDLLKSIYDLRLPENSIVFIPRDHLYWKALSCEKTPLLFQALTGVPMINGQPDKNCSNALGLYGFDIYGIPFMEPTEDFLCKNSKGRTLYRLSRQGKAEQLCTRQ